MADLCDQFPNAKQHKLDASEIMVGVIAEYKYAHDFVCTFG